MTTFVLLQIVLLSGPTLSAPCLNATPGGQTSIPVNTESAFNLSSGYYNYASFWDGDIRSGNPGYESYVGTVQCITSHSSIANMDSVQFNFQYLLGYNAQTSSDYPAMQLILMAAAGTVVPLKWWNFTAEDEEKYPYDTIAGGPTFSDLTENTILTDTDLNGDSWIFVIRFINNAYNVHILLESMTLTVNWADPTTVYPIEPSLEPTHIPTSIPTNIPSSVPTYIPTSGFDRGTFIFHRCTFIILYM